MNQIQMKKLNDGIIEATERLDGIIESLKEVNAERGKLLKQKEVRTRVQQLKLDVNNKRWMQIHGVTHEGTAIAVVSNFFYMINEAFRGLL